MGFRGRTTFIILILRTSVPTGHPPLPSPWGRPENFHRFLAKAPLWHSCRWERAQRMMVGKSDGKENWLEVGKEKGEGRCFASRQPLLSRQPVTLVHACTEWCKETEHGLWVWKCISGGRGLGSPLYSGVPNVSSSLILIVVMTATTTTKAMTTAIITRRSPQHHCLEVRGLRKKSPRDHICIY